MQTSCVRIQCFVQLNVQEFEDTLRLDLINLESGLIPNDIYSKLRLECFAYTIL